MTMAVGTDAVYEVWRCKKDDKTLLCNSLANPGTDPWEMVTPSGGITATDWFDTLPSGDVFRKTSNPKNKYSYQVKAVNTTCSTQSPQPSSLSIVYAPCN